MEIWFLKMTRHTHCLLIFDRFLVNFYFLIILYIYININNVVVLNIFRFVKLSLHHAPVFFVSLTFFFFGNLEKVNFDWMKFDTRTRPMFFFSGADSGRQEGRALQENSGD